MHSREVVVGSSIKAIALGVWMGFIVGCPSSHPVPDAILTLKAQSQALPADGTSIELSIIATAEDGGPGSGEVVVRAPHGTLNGQTGEVFLALEGGGASVKYACDFRLDPDCKGAQRLSATWNGVLSSFSLCASATCAVQGKDCGPLTNGCGMTLQCGSCAEPLICGVLGNQNVCEAPLFERVCTAGGWCWQNPLPGGAAHEALHGSGPDDIWVGNSDGSMLHWNGSRWSFFRSPANSPVAALLVQSPTEARAVTRSMEVLQWNGSTWSLIGSAESLKLNSAWWAGPDDLWGVSCGSVPGCARPVDAFCAGSTGGLTLHWDGTGWTRVDNPAEEQAEFFTVWGRTSTDIWAGGGCSAIIRWDGKTWQRVPNHTGYYVTGFWGHSADDVWATGQGPILHWDGREWSSFVDPTATTAGYYSLGGTLPNDLWATSAGDLDNSVRFGTFYAHRWNGTAWSQVDTGLHFDLSQVWGPTANDLWGIGGAGLAHWDGSQWTEISRSARGSRAATLRDVCTTGSSEAWAVGRTSIYSGSFSGILLHWDGSGAWEWYPDEWERPDEPATHTNSLNALWCASQQDVWAVGSRGRVLHYDGKKWALSVVNSNVDFEDVWGSGPQDVWAVGSKQSGYGGVIYHWNGSVWSLVPTPAGSLQFLALNGVMGSGPADVWAVGDSGFIIHWDGKSWEQVDRLTTAELLAVWVDSAHEAWAVGRKGTTLHWNGSAWARVPNPVEGPYSELHGLSGRGPQDIWASGNAGLLHWNGTGWSQVETGARIGSVLRGLFSEPSGRTWAVGDDGTILRRDGG